MSQIGSVNVNFNLPASQQNRVNVAKTLVIGVSQRGPIYKVVEITNINKFIIVFGQPTNKYEFDFFQAMKSVVDNGGKALCYRIPYTDDKKLDDVELEYYIAQDFRFDIALKDLATSQYYSLIVNDDLQFQHVLEILPIERTTNKVDYIVLKSNKNFYKMFIQNKQIFIEKIYNYDKPENVYSQFFIRHINEEKFNYCLSVYENYDSVNEIGLYLLYVPVCNKIISDVKYKSNSDFDIDNYQAKLTFTPINDFNSILKIKKNDDDTTEISANEICYHTKVDIDPSQIIGVFPVLFATKDAENVRNLDFGEVYPFSANTDHYVDAFNVYACDGNAPYRITSATIFDDLFSEFEKSTHFKKNWLEEELTKLMDFYVPQDISTAPNTMGVVFIAYFLDDEHKLDYKILESFYGLIGYSDKRYKNLEDLVNKHSNFFRLHIEGVIEKQQYLRALNRDSLNIAGKNWVLPMISPFSDDSHLVDMTSIFSSEPPTKFNDVYSQTLPRLINKLSKVEFLNSAPFDYIVAPGLADIMLLKPKNPNAEKIRYKDSLVEYIDYQVDLDNDVSISITKVEDVYEPNEQYENVASLYRFLTFGTNLGDKGSISIIDVPQIFNDLFIVNRDRCVSEVDIKKMIKVLDYIFPNLKGTREIYNRTYPICNYQRVDKDRRLTRYHKIRPLRKFELVPGSAMMVGAYINETTRYVFYPIAGPRIRDLFRTCHNCYIDMKRPDLFKVLFDVYGVSSLINDRDNNTFPIQQTTWRKTTSILKQLHAFRIYVAIRRRAYDIARSYLYEPNIESIRNEMLSSLNYLINLFKENNYIDGNSNVKLWADISDIEQHQVQVVITLGIYGAIVKIIMNMNLQNMTIEIIQ